MAAILSMIEPEIAPFDPSTRKSWHRTKREVDRMSDDPLRRYGHLKFDISRGVHLGGGRSCRRSYSYHSKEWCWFPIGSPLWPYLWPFGRDLPTNVCDAQINRGWVTLGQKFGKANGTPRLTNSEIIFEEFQPIRSQ